MASKRNDKAKDQAVRVQKRGQETHDRIVEAAIRLLSRYGALGVTHRAVAEEAGVSLALTTYHFASKDDILWKAYNRLYEDEVRRFRSIYKSPESLRADETIDYITTQVIREATEFKDESIAGCELMLEAFRSKELSGAVRKVFEEKVAFWRQAAEKMKTADPDADAEILFCTVVGAFLIMMARGTVQSDLSRTRKKIEYDLAALRS